MTNDDGLPVKTVTIFAKLSEICEELGENTNLLICEVDKEILFKEFPETGFPMLNFSVWSTRYVFICYADILLDISYALRNPMRVSNI